MVDKLEAGKRWQHVKRGTFYDVIGRAELQNGNVRGLREGADLVVYRGEDGKLWARDAGEFADGRFVPVAPATVTENAKVADTDWRAEMPTIWEDPAGKGYPCFERPMTPAEARDTIERYGRQLAERENATEDARERVKALEEVLRDILAADDAGETWGAAALRARTALGNKETDRHG